MALTVQQRRRRDTILGVLAMGVILFALLGKSVVQAIVIPALPGYAKEPPSGQYAPLDWRILQQGRWEYEQPPEVPAAIRAFDGKPVLLRGFLLPLHQPGVASEFYAAEKPRGCYFCNPPGIAEVIHIKIAGRKDLSPTDWPVKVYGTFHAASGSNKDTALYTIENATLVITR